MTPMHSDENNPGTPQATRSEKARRAAELSARASVAPGRTSQRRLTRTIVLGTLAVVAAIGWLTREFGLDVRELASFLGQSLVLVGILIACGFAGAYLLRLISRLRK